MSQQEIIDLAISSYLKTHDNIAKQYLKLRQEAVEVTQNIQKEISDSGAASAESILKLDKLKFECAKMSISYKAYISNLDRNLEIPNTTAHHSLVELNHKYETFCQEKIEREKEAEQLLTQHKPVIEKMRLLSSSFEKSMTRRRKRSNDNNRIFSEKGSNPNEDSVCLDYASAVFTRKELEEQLKDVESELAHLRTVDQINESHIDSTSISTSDSTSISTSTSTIQERVPSINLTKYLDDLLQGSRVFQKVDDTHYKFDMVKSSILDKETSTTVLSDYEASVHELTKQIQLIVARGTEAKERWIANALKLETIQGLFTEDMEIDG